VNGSKGKSYSLRDIAEGGPDISVTGYLEGGRDGMTCGRGAAKKTMKKEKGVGHRHRSPRIIRVKREGEETVKSLATPGVLEEKREAGRSDS